MDSTIIIPFIKGRIISLLKFFAPHFVIFITMKLKPIFEIKMLNNTAIDVPNIPHLIEKG